MMYGQQYREQISEVIRHAAELCDCLQCFFLIHSMGGGSLFLSFLLGLSINSLHCLINISYNLSSANLARAKQYPETEIFFPLITYQQIYGYFKKNLCLGNYRK